MHKKKIKTALTILFLTGLYVPVHKASSGRSFNPIKNLYNKGCLLCSNKYFIPTLAATSFLLACAAYGIYLYNKKPIIKTNSQELPEEATTPSHNPLSSEPVEPPTNPLMLAEESAGSSSDQEGDNMAALMHAAKLNDVNAAEAALVNGADPNAQTNEGMTALMFNATTARTPEVLQLLINAGANVDLQDNNGTTALMFAAANITSFPENSVNDPIIETLVRLGNPDISIQDNRGNTAINHIPVTDTNLRIKQRRRYLTEQLMQQSPHAPREE